MCLYPKLIKNRKYVPNKKNGGKPPVLPDKRVEYVPVGCQNCIECRRKKAREWQVRLLEDVRHNKNGKFVTFTLSDQAIADLNREIDKDIKGYLRDNAIMTLAIRRFLERWRKKYKKSVRHWLVTELGHNGTENIHAHGIVWTDNIDDIEKIWGYGFVWTGKQKNGTYVNYVNEKTVNYLTKYVHKQDLDHKHYKPKIFTSPGIGAGYISRQDSHLNKYQGTNTKEYYVTRTGHKLALPIYWRNKLYSEQEREKLWLNLLDREERWIMGERVEFKTKEDQERYFKLLAFYRAKNLRLGYGSDEIDWEQRQYENNLRRLKLAERVAKGLKKNNNNKNKTPKNSAAPLGSSEDT